MNMNCLKRKYYHFKRKIFNIGRSRDIIINDTKEISDRYVDLAPIASTKDNEAYYKSIKEYFNALNWALNNHKVMNIAITGPYGSGKSSLINSYIDKHSELKLIKISLANFDETKIYEKSQGEKDNETSFTDSGEGGAETDGFHDNLDDELINGILRQLFYKVNKNEIPQSRYRKLEVINQKVLLAKIILFIIACLLLSFFFIDNAKVVLEGFLNNAQNNFGFDGWKLYVVGSILFTIVLFFLEKTVLKVMSRISIQEIKFSDKAGATLSNDDEKTIFHKNLDEVVYFFESTGYNVVFIEDLDRFKNQKIFIKLRELNTILNQYDKIKKRVVFIYAVRDDLFNDTDRTKFFEFIIPIIPVISSSNSKDKLWERIKNDKKKYGDIDIDENYIDLVSPYINDMRLLNNIYNEFLTYKKSLEGMYNLNLKDIQFFSLILFKNLYPNDFSDLQNDKGIVKDIFEIKRSKILEKRIEIERLRDENLDLLERIDRDVLKDIREVKLSILYFLTGNQGMLKRADSSTESFTHEFILDDDFEVEKLSSINTVYYWNAASNNPQNYSFVNNGSKEELNKFIKRCKEIRNKSLRENEMIKSKIEELGKEINLINGKSLKELIADYGSEDILPKNIRDNKLLTFLIRNGFIDEEYHNYINYFYENSITQGEMNFILSIRNFEAMDFSYRLVNISQIIKKLQLHEFEQKEIYNFDLLDYLLVNNSDRNELYMLMKQLSDEHEKSWVFIDEYIEISKNIPEFVSTLCYMWPNMWNFIYLNSTLTADKKSRYFVNICNYSSIDSIIALDQSGRVKEYFEDNKEILKMLRIISKEKIVDIIDNLDVRFRDSDFGSIEIDLFDWIYENKKFILNETMIKKIFEFKYPNELINISLHNYTTIRELNCQPLIELIEEDVQHYVENIVLGITTNVEEKIDWLLELIEKVEDTGLAKRLIEKECVVLDYLSKCDFPYLHEDENSHLKTVWGQWIDQNKLIGSYENLVKYWDDFGFDDNINTYLTNKVEEFMIQECPKDISEDLVVDLITSNLQLPVYKEYILAIPKIGNKVYLSDIDYNHMRVLLELHYFEFDKEFAKELKDEHIDLYVEALILNNEKVISNVTNYNLDINDTTLLVESEEFSDEEKIKLINESNLPNYNYKIAFYLRNTKLLLNNDMFDSAWEVLEVKDRYELFINQITTLDNDKLSICFSELDDEHKELSNRDSSRKVVLALNDYNIKLLEHLKDSKYITSYHIENDHIDCRVKKVK